MKRMLNILSIFLLVGSIPSPFLFSYSVQIEEASGAIVELGIDPDDRFLDVLDHLRFFLAEKEGIDSGDSNFFHKNSSNASFLNLIVSNTGVTARAQKLSGRDYFAPLKKEEKDDVSFIVSKLAWDSPMDIWGHQSDLENAGERIHHLHPLNFLYIVFSSDKLTAAISAIKERKIPKLKSGFFNGLIDSLRDEANSNNLLQYVDHFSKRLEINKNKITPFLEKKMYSEFVDCLITLKPRKNADRHNM
ncbi:MAG: hypothetical protein ACH350_02265 [Parachlamydiaceae bacterium]